MSDLNGHTQKAITNPAVLEESIQARADSDISSPVNSIAWFGRDIDTYNDLGISVPPWWSELRDLALDRFVYTSGNDILQGAVSSLTKKIKAMDWYLTGPEKTVARYQKVLAQSEFGQGWDRLIGKTIQPYLTQDKGAFWELIGAGDIDGPLLGPVMGIAHLDSRYCQLTGDPVYPVIYNNAKDNKAHKIHCTRVVHMVDMPSPSDQMNNIGFCGVSRVLASSSVLLKLAKYKNEKLDDLPEAGLLIFNNILPQKWDDARAEYQRERRRLGQQYWANVMTFFSLDPANQASATLTSFANLPDNFDELQTTNIYVNILALAFGVDVREFWPISEGGLGTGRETLVQHQKAKGKGVGDLISSIEWAINWHILPPSVEFAFDFQDDEEDKQRAEIEDIKIDSILKMAQTITTESGTQFSIATWNEIRQMLADNTSYFSEDFLTIDETDEDTQYSQDRQEKSYGLIRTIGRDGRFRRKSKFNKMRTSFSQAIQLAHQNYQAGKVSEKDLAEYVISIMAEG